MRVACFVHCFRACSRLLRHGRRLGALRFKSVLKRIDREVRNITIRGARFYASPEMKFILQLTLALSFLALAPVLLAQDAAAPFRRTSPTPAPEETPAPGPSVTPADQQDVPRRAQDTATPGAEPPKPAPPAGSKPARRVLGLEPVRAVEPRSPGSRHPSPAAPRQDPAGRGEGPAEAGERERDTADKPSRSASSPVRERVQDREEPPAPARSNRAVALDYWDDDPGSAVKRLERLWQKAIVDKDVETINELLASDFVATSSTGRVGSKSTIVNAIRRDKNEYKSADARGMSVRMLGSRVAVVTGVATEAGTTPDGRGFRNARRFTDTWMLRDGKWVCVASQATELSND